LKSVSDVLRLDDGVGVVEDVFDVVERRA